jgi:hypothetical protein
LLLVGLHSTVQAQNGHEGQTDPDKYYGQSAQLGRQEVRTYVVLSKDRDERSGRRRPAEVGVEMPLAVMDNLPRETQVLNLNFPVQARDTTIQFMMLGWTPQGHEPPGIYDRPHLDFHFYIQDFAEVMAIDPGNCSGLDCDDYARAVKPVPPQFVPNGYIDRGIVVPMMGNHLVDPTAPEFNGQLFTRTLLYGAYDGQITFFEPMITNESLLRQPRACARLKLPQEYTQTAYQPRQYCSEVDRSKQVVRVLLTDFVYRVAPNQGLTAIQR